MANREMERYKTREYTTSEGVNVTEEHLKFPLRKEMPGTELSAKDICEFDLVTFDKAGRTPVYWVRESEWNQCEDRHLQRCVDSTTYSELTDRRREISPEDVTLYLERKNGSVNQVPYYTPPLGEGRCNRDPEQQASRELIDEACKKNLGCEEKLTAQHLHEQDISKEELFDNKQRTKTPDAELWQKIGDLHQKAELEAGQQKLQEQEAKDQEQSKKR